MELEATTREKKKAKGRLQFKKHSTTAGAVNVAVKMKEGARLDMKRFERTPRIGVAVGREKEGFERGPKMEKTHPYRGANCTPQKNDGQ